MPRARAFAPLLCLWLLAPAARAAEPEDRPSPDPGPVSVEAVEEAAAEAQYRAHVRDAEKARAAGRLGDAAHAYSAAFKIRREPIMAGRLGVLLVELEIHDRAAALLNDAIQRAVDATPAERQAFFRAYEKVKTKGSWVLVTLSHAGAEMTLDGEPFNQRRSSALWLFLLSGPHQMRGSLHGYEDVETSFTVVAGKEGRVMFTFQPRPTPTCAPPEPAPVATPAVEVVPSAPSTPLAATKAKAESALGVYVERYTKQEDPYADDEQPAKPEKKAPMRGFVGVGPVVVFGAATWAPAVGASITGGLRLHEHVSVELEGRAAWLAGGVKGEAISTMTAGGVLGLCANWRYFFGCGLGHLGVIAVNWDEAKYERGSDVFFSPGFGGRLGARLDLGSSWGLQVAGDVLGLSRGTRIVVGQTVLVEQPAVMMSTSLALLRKF